MKYKLKTVNIGFSLIKPYYSEERRTREIDIYFKSILGQYGKNNAFTYLSLHEVKLISKELIKPEYII